MSVVLNYITNAAFKNECISLSLDVVVGEVNRQSDSRYHFTFTDYVDKFPFIFFACDFCDFLCHRE